MKSTSTESSRGSAVARSVERTGGQRTLWEVQQDNGTGRRANGEKIPSWQKAFDTFVEMMPLTAREFMNGPQVQANITHKIRVRWRADKVLTADMRLVQLPAKTRALYLAGPAKNVDERNEFWEFLAVEVVVNPQE